MNSLLFSLYLTHYFVHYLRINLADKMSLLLYWVTNHQYAFLALEHVYTVNLICNYDIKFWVKHVQAPCNDSKSEVFLCSMMNSCWKNMQFIGKLKYSIPSYLSNNNCFYARNREKNQCKVYPILTAVTSHANAVSASNYRSRGTFALACLSTQSKSNFGWRA